MKPVINLYDSVGLGIILAFPSGVIISNQTGGTSCLSPEMEGIYVPLRNDYQIPDGVFLSPELQLTRHFVGPKHRGAGATGGIDDTDAYVIDSILDEARLRPSVSVDRTRLADSREAWIHIMISSDESSDRALALFARFGPYPRPGVLTWSNSD